MGKNFCESLLEYTLESSPKKRDIIMKELEYLHPKGDSNGTLPKDHSMETACELLGIEIPKHEEIDGIEAEAEV
jgi:hypothetical protein